MRRDSGFTLIELVVVIVILGILAAFAVPRFLGMQKEARISSLQGLQGSIHAAVSLTHAKAMASGNATIPSKEVVGSLEDIDTVGSLSGSQGVFPVANASGIVRALQDTSGFRTTDSSSINVLNIFGETNTYSIVTADPNTNIVFYPEGMEEMSEDEEYDCALLYAANSTEYGVSIATDDC